MKHLHFLIFILIISSNIQAQNFTLVGPPDIVVSCSFPFTMSDLTDTSSDVFGKVVIIKNNQFYRNKVRTQDKVCHRMCETINKMNYPNGGDGQFPTAGSYACTYYTTFFDTLKKDQTYDLIWGYEGFVMSTFTDSLVISVTDKRTCHQGQIIRRFTDYGPNFFEAWTNQTIWVIDCEPFYINALDPCDPNDDIEWPHCGKDLVLNSCANSPPDSIKHNPIKDSLTSLTINYTDNIINTDPNYCFTILRDWTVIDWCQYDPTTVPPAGSWTYEEVIHIIDTLAPKNTITGFHCREADSTGLAFITLSDIATDDCTPKDWIYYTYYIDLNNDGIGKYNGYDLKVGPLLKREIGNMVPANHDNQYALNKNDPSIADGRYPVGSHKILFQTEDGCRNISKDSFYFNILSPEPPKYDCPTHDFIYTVELPKTYVFDIKNIVIFDKDNCTSFENLQVFLDGDSNKTKDLINCIDYIENGSKDTLNRTYQVWVRDESGNATICPIHVIYIFKGTCDSSHTRYFTGHFIDRNNNDIENLDLEISSPALGTINFSTGCDHSFTITTLDDDKGYRISAKKKDFINNGLDVLDVVYLQKHILGIQTLENYLSLLAGDINSSTSLTASDVVLLERRILGIPNVPSSSADSWRFYLGKDTSYTTPSLYVTDSVSNFIGIKIGDANGDALVRCSDRRPKRNSCLNLTYPSFKFEKGKSYFIPVSSSNFQEIYGLQLSIQYNTNAIQLDTIKLNKLNGTLTNLSPTQLSSGQASLIHVDQGLTETFTASDTLFTLRVTALQNYSGNDFLQVSDDPTYSIAYDKDELPLSICLNGVSTNSVELQNEKLIIYPNPASTTFNFRIPDNTKAFALKIFNVIGQCVYFNEYRNIPGSVISVDGSYMKEAGAYYLTAQTKEKTYNAVLIKE